MSTAPNSYPSLCSSPPLSKTSTKQALPSFVTFKPSFLSKNAKSLDFSIRVGNSGSGKRSVFIVRAENGETEGEEKYEEYEVEIEQPYGLKFAKGRDGATYIDAIAPGGSADKTKMFSVGDKVLATSAVFGTEMWPAAEYGRTMYTIRQRIGPLLMRMEKRYGGRKIQVSLQKGDHQG